MKTKFTVNLKSLHKLLLLFACFGMSSATFHANAQLAGGNSYWVTGTANVVAPVDTFVDLAGTNGVITYLNANGVDPLSAGQISIWLTSGYTGVETAPVTIGTTAGGYANMALSRNIVIKPVAGANITITTTATLSGALLRFSGAQFVTIDGEGTAGQRNLSFVMPAAATGTNLRVIEVIPTSTVGCQSLTVKNCNLMGNSGTTVANTYAGFYLGGASSPSNALRRSQNISVINNVIEAVQAGIYIRGAAGTANNHDVGLMVSNNIIGGVIAPGGPANTTYFGGTSAAHGIYLGAQLNATVTNNIIRNSAFAVASGLGVRGITLTSEGGTASLDSNISITNNKIYNLFINSSGVGACGIRIQLGSHTFPTNITLANNTIAKIQGTNSTGTISSFNYPIGISIEDITANAGVNIYHNSINLYGDTMTSNGISACLVTGASLTGGVNVLNNIFSNRMGKIFLSGTLPTTTYAVISNSATANPFTNINNNAYYINTYSGGNAFVGFGLNKGRVSLDQWKAFTTFDANSITDIPAFVGNDDTTLVIANGAGSRLGSAGTLIAGYTTDINGTTRPSTPSLGAYQFTANTTLAYYPLVGGTTYPIAGTNSWPVGTSGAGQFATVSEAINYLNTYGVTGTGDIVLMVSSGYQKFNERYIPHIIDFSGAASTRRVLLRPATNYVDTIMLPSNINTFNQAAVFRFIGTRFFTLSGGTPTARNLTLFIPSTVGVNTAKVISITPGENTPCTDLIIRNLNISGSSNATNNFTFAGIYHGAHNVGTSTQAASAPIGGNDNITIQNNWIEAVQNGIYVRGANLAAVQNSGWNITRNIIGGVMPSGSSPRTTYIGSGSTTNLAGILLKSLANATVDSNIIRNNLPAGNGFRGIDITTLGETSGRDSNITVSKNFIYNITASGATAYGILINLANESNRKLSLINNSIAGIKATGAGANSNVNNPSGITVDATAAISNLDLTMYYNTINLNGTTLLGSNSSYGVYLSSNIQGGVKMRSNNIVNKLGRAGTITTPGAIFGVLAAAPIANNPLLVASSGESNTNNIAAAGNNSVNYVGAANNAATFYSDIVAWRAFTLQDAGSVSFPVLFASDTMPDVDGASGAPIYNIGSGSFTTGISKDIYNNTRGATTTSIGAVQFTTDYLPLAGGQTYLINGVQNPPRTSGTAPFSFATVNRAFQYINANGVDNTLAPANNINIVISAGYNGEGDTLITPLINYPRANANRIIVLKPDVSRNDTIRTTGVLNPYAANGSVIRFAGASYFIIEGSNNGTTTRNLTIMLPATASNSSNNNKVIDLVPLNGPNTNIVIRHCNIIGNSNTTTNNTYAGIYMGGISSTPSNPLRAANSNNRFINNFIGAAKYGIFVRGADSAAAYDQANMIRRNEIGGDIAPAGTLNTNYFGGAQQAAGISISGQSAAIIDSNVVRNNIRSFASNSGIELAVGTGTNAINQNISISRNIIYNIGSTVPAASSFGISMTFGAATTNRNISVNNNMISKISSPGSATPINNPVGIAVDNLAILNDAGLSINYNSVNLSGNALAAGGISSCVVINTNVKGGVSMRNNIFQNTLGRTTGSAAANAVVLGSPTSVFSTIDNNDYFVNAPLSTNRLMASNAGTTGYTTLAAVKGFTLQDTMSISFVAPFTNDSTLSIPINTASPIWGSALPLASVTTDLFGNTRSAFSPTMGAHEYVGSYSDSVAPIIYNVTPPASTCSNGPYTITMRVIERTLAFDTLYYSVNGGPELFTLVASVSGAYNRNYIIPAQAANASIRYRLVARDASAQGFVSSYPASGYDNIGSVFTVFPVVTGFDASNGGWTTEQVSGNGLWQIGVSSAPGAPSLSPQTGIKAAIFPSATLANGTTARLVSPCLDFTNLNVPTVRVWISQSNDNPAILDQINVVATAGGGFWSAPLRSISRVNTNFAFPGYKQFDICLDLFANLPGVKVGFEGVAKGNGANIIIDSIIIFNDVQNYAITPLNNTICAYNPISLNVAGSAANYEYALVNTFTGLPISSTVAGTGSGLTLTAPNPQSDISVNVSYRNTTSGCFNSAPLLHDTAKIVVKLFTGGPFVTKGTPFKGAFNGGTSLTPDGALVGDTLTYNLVAPSGLAYSTYGTQWTVLNQSIKTASGYNMVNTTYNAPTTSGQGTYTARIGSQDADSTFILSVTYRLLPTNCDSIVTRYIKITSAPVASFTNGGRDSVCAGSPLVLSNTTTASAVTLPVTYKWYFGDGDSSTAVQPVKTYATPGQYQLRLIATNASGISNTVQKTITVLVVPVPSFTNSQVCGNDSVSFTSTSTGTGLTYQWSFTGAGSSNSSTLANPKMSFASIDTTYNVNLTVTNNLGCAKSVSKTIYVFPKPVAGFTIGNACQSALVPLTNSTTISSTKTGNSFGSTWDFGNGQTGLSNTPAQRYETAAGNYNVKLVVTTNFGCKDSITKPVTIFEKPKVSFAYSNACKSDAIKLTNGTTYSSGLGNVNFTWNFGDFTTSNAATPSKTYQAIGTYQLSLLAVDNTNGCRDSVAKTVTINEKPFAGYTVDNGCKNTALRFSNVSFGTTGDSLLYTWTFGDAGSSSERNPSHNYATTGTFNTQLIVSSNSQGCSDTATAQVTITAPPTIHLVKTPLDAHNLKVTFRAGFNQPKTTFHWDFGDGSSTNTVVDSFTKDYTSSGDYWVKVTVRDSIGCASTDSVLVGPRTGLSDEVAAKFNFNVYPNPFADKTAVTFTLGKSAKVSLKVFDMLGRKVADINNGDMSAGAHAIELDQAKFNTRSGVYLIQLMIDDAMITRQLIQQ